MQTAWLLRLIRNLSKSISFLPAPRERPIEGLAHGQAERGTSDRRQHGYSAAFGIAVGRVDEF